MRLNRWICLTGIGLLPAGAWAQPGADHVDPTILRENPPQPVQDAARPTVRVEVDAPSGAAAATGRDVFVGAITLSGLRRLAPSDFSDIIAERIGRSYSAAELSSLANAIARRMHDRGYAFASAWIKPQRIANGVLTVDVDEGRIDEIRFEGPATPAMRRALAPLRSSGPARIEEVERRLLLAGDIDGTRVQSSRFLREGGRGVLVVRVSRDRAALRAYLTNAGTRPIGPEQARIELDLNGVLASDDSLTMSYATAPAQPRELHAGFVRYEKRVSADGTEVAFSGSLASTHPGSYLSPLEIRNRSWYAAASVLQPLLRRRKASLWLEGELGVRNLSQWRRGFRTRDDQLTIARLTLYGYGDLAGGRLRASGTLSQGLGILGATRASDPLASRRDADGTFTTASLWADWTRDLGGRFSLRLAAQGQLASDPLLISEEIALGGTGFLRGYDWGERSGDEGAIGMAELRYLWKGRFGPAKRAQFYVYADGGTVSNHAGGFGGGSLASAGGGTRMDITDSLGATLEVAVPLSGPRYDTGDESPKLNFAVKRTF